jgi:hypothetical protein
MLIKTSSGLLGKVAGRMQGGLGGVSGGLTKMARGRTAENMGLAKGRLLTGQAKGRFGRRAFSGASRAAQRFDTGTRTRKLENETLSSYRDADWQEQVAQNAQLQDMHVATQVNQAREGSARRVQNKHYYDTLGAQGQELYTAAGIDERGEERVLASVIAQKQKENREAVENSKALLHNGDAGGTIGRAVQQLEQANESGDTIAARAAAQVLRESGTPGRAQLHEAITRIQNTPTGLNNEIAENIKADGLAAGVKAYDSSMDQWNASASGAKLSDFVSDPKSAARLNQVELAGQLKEQLKTWQSTGVLTREQAKAVLAAHEKGTIPLDLEKKAIFELAAK